MKLDHDSAPPELLALGQASVPVEPANRRAARREALWPSFLESLERASKPKRQVSRRAALQRAGAVVLAATALAASWAIARPTLAPPAIVSVPAVVSIEVPRPTVSAAEAGDSWAAFELANGVRVRTEAGASVAFDATARVEIRRGAAGFSVPRLPAPERFAVHTPDAEVVVHGTEFSVAVRERARTNGTRTFVSVRKGLVAVHHGGTVTMLHGGESWSSAPEDALSPSATATLPEPSPPKSPNPRKPKPSAAPTTAAVASSAPEPPSTLGQQNELFDRAMVARRAGDDAEAIRLLDELRKNYPNSPLDAAARRERNRAFGRLERRQGAEGN